MSGDRDNVFATRMTLGLYKTKVKGARKGYELLKRKADALKVRLRRMMNEDLTAKLPDCFCPPGCPDIGLKKQCACRHLLPLAAREIVENGHLVTCR